MLIRLWRKLIVLLLASACSSDLPASRAGKGQSSDEAPEGDDEGEGDGDAPPTDAGEEAEPSGEDDDVTADDADASTDGDEIAADDGESTTLKCREPVFKKYDITKAFPLQCPTTSPSQVTFQHDLDGVVVARALMRLKNVLPSGAVYFWSVSVRVGEPIYAQAIGDDMCPTYGPFLKTNLGIGKVGPEKRTIALAGMNGSTSCSNGSIYLLAGSWIETWTFDDRPGCEDGLPVYFSWIKENGQGLFHWATTFKPVGEVDFSGIKAEKLRAFAVSEGSPHSNPNPACGSETATLSTRLLLDDKPVANSKGQINGGPGMGHLVSSLAATFDKGDSRRMTLELGSNFVGTVTTGGCCGDAMVVVMPAAPNDPAPP